MTINGCVFLHILNYYTNYCSMLHQLAAINHFIVTLVNQDRKHTMTNTT